MTHPSHKLKAYTADPHKPLIFCMGCGKEGDEDLSEPCSEQFYQKAVDTIHDKSYKGFVMDYQTD